MIGIIGAMQTEVELLIGNIENKKIENISGIAFVSGKLSGADVVVAKCGIGTVFAALCAQTMILKYGVELIINTGVGGAIDESLDIGDVAVSDFVVQHDMDTTALGDPIGLISGINVVRIEADKGTANELLDVAEGSGVHAVLGTVASGDKFISGAEAKKRIRDTFGAAVCEMEGAAIGQVCYVNEVPFCVIRAVSDKADGTSGVDYMTFVDSAAKKNASIVLSYLARKNNCIVFL